ncbi:MAG: prepilin-type N-terminal cleavage/methylation domain-containing protein [Phycisphaerales bacterium]|nr:prepilin-type N-terminal cleavage/methylation domain-containing protein [Phycisphaerales bacterium]
MRPRGFTLVELVLVVIVLAITAGMVLPRMVSPDRHRAEAAARALRDVVSAAARREALTSEPVALDFDSETGVLSVLTPVPRGAGDWSRSIVWRPDPMTPPAALAPLEVVKATADDVPLPAKRWRVVMQAADRRPALRLSLRSSSGTWTIDLPSESAAASLAEGDTPPATSIDLDRSGLRDAAW